MTMITPTEASRRPDTSDVEWNVNRPILHLASAQPPVCSLADAPPHQRQQDERDDHAERVDGEEHAATNGLAPCRCEHQDRAEDRARAEPGETVREAECVDRSRRSCPTVAPRSLGCGDRRGRIRHRTRRQQAEPDDDESGDGHHRLLVGAHEDRRRRRRHPERYQRGDQADDRRPRCVRAACRGGRTRRRRTTAAAARRTG